MVSFTPQPLLPHEIAVGGPSVGDWVASTPGLYDVEKREFFTLLELELGLLCLRARCQSLYRLSYRISLWKVKFLSNRKQWISTTRVIAALGSVTLKT
jgi:hypothetical protein